MDPSFLKIAEEDLQCHKIAQDYFDQGNHIKALEVIEDVYSKRGKEYIPGIIHFLQGTILIHLASTTKNSDMKFVYLLSSVEPFTEDISVTAFPATSFFEMAKHLDSELYYKKALKIVKQSISLLNSYDQLTSNDQDTIRALGSIIKEAESKILLGCTGKKSEPTLGKSKEVQDTIGSFKSNAAGERLRSYWASMNVEGKRNFMKVSIAKLRSYVERLYGKEGQDALEPVLDSVRVNKKWRFWMCRTCSQKFYYVKKFKNHLEQEHAAKFKPSTTKHMVQRLDEVWAGMISVAGWEPVDAAAAVELIKTRLDFVKEFVYENGWSKDWPLAADEERRKLLKEIQSLLVSLWEHKVLSCSIRDLIMHFPIAYLAQFEVTEHTLTECRLVETPQSICFLDSRELNQILGFLKLIKCERDDGTDLVCRAVDSLCARSRVKEKIEFDDQFSVMLLDKRLLRGEIASFDDEGIIHVCHQNDYYAKTHPQGDHIITWLLSHPVIDESFEFPRSVRAHNLDIWVAVLRAIHFTCRTIRTKHAKKLEMVGYYHSLVDAKNLCISEDERRKNVPEDQWNVYASLLGDQCEEHITTDGRDSPNTKMFLCAVQDILKEASCPTSVFLDQEHYLNHIHEHKNLSDDIVLKSIDLLKSWVTIKVRLIDSKILLVENSRLTLLNELTRLSVFDYRSYILNLIKRFLLEELEGIVDMDAKAKVAAAEADLLSGEKQEKEKTSGSKKKKRRGIKRTSTSVSSVLEENVKHESSVDHEPGVISLKTTEEDSMEPEDTLSSERGRLDGSSNIDNQEEATKDMQNMPGEDSLSKHMESPHGAAATRCNLALDMTLKALCNIKFLKEYLVHNRHQFPDNLEEQVPGALRNFFAAFASKEIKEEGLYSYLLGNLHASLEESTDAAELLVSILEFWPCWKNPDMESFVTSLFTLEEYERMSCSKCRKSPNYPEQSSYGIVMAAESIRELKCADGNMKLEEILMVIRMKDGMLCDIKTEGCGNANIVHHIINRCPPIFTVVLTWEKNETEKDIHETTKALHWEIDISKLYEDLEPNTKYRLVSMVGCGEEEEYICLAFKKNRWISFRHKALVKKVVGSWKNVVRYCEEKNVRLEILFYEAVQCPNK